MIKITLHELQKTVGPFNTLLNEKLPIVAGFKINKLIKEINKDLQNFEEQRNKLIEKLGEKKEDGATEVLPERYREFQEEMVQLLELVVEVNVEPLSISDLKDASITPVELALLEKFIVEG
jgi:predicted  nucleic acid-binding Zn-ribbon protein